MAGPMSMRLPHRVEYARDLLWVLVLKELRVRYKRTVLGYSWSLLQPLAFATVYYLVFKQFLRVPTGDVPYTVFLICGLFSWQWFANGVNASTYALVSNAPLITKVKFPRVYAVLSGCMNDLTHFLLSMPVVLLVVLGLGQSAHVSWLWQFPLILLIQLVLVVGLSLLCATLTLFLRDLERLVSIGVLMLFHLTPVVYPESLIPARFQWVLYANPMGAMTVNWREMLLHGRLDPAMLGVSSLMAVVALAVGVAVFTKLQPRFAEVV
ncbi:ABC transporter permease [Algisphaera agarilytica]|uniref:Transport permease protein n=1 Tax=Algisphaera agarilytica TaxID=1385975 RepID=A0A7X0H950_9BACT|nr:ABC transporter permease [Algisphaera agarilytica]MBB6430120.1 lipopolysaccharide transport system permease protein [Algisphaera agarilytica]